MKMKNTGRHRSRLISCLSMLIDLFRKEQVIDEAKARELLGGREYKIEVREWYAGGLGVQKRPVYVTNKTGDAFVTQLAKDWPYSSQRVFLTRKGRTIETGFFDARTKTDIKYRLRLS